MRQLGRTLRRLREQVGITQEEAGAKLRFSAKKMSRIEQGQLPGYHELRAMLDTYGLTVDQWDPIIGLFDRASEKGWWHAYGVDDRGFVSVEAEASMKREYQLGFVPGLLQTEPYIRQLFDSAHTPLTGQTLENQVAVRLRRQRRLVEEPPLGMHAVVDESALRRPVCAPGDQRGQLRRVLELAELPNVTVQVVPQGRGAYNGQYGNFLVVSFPDPEEPDLAYIEHSFTSVYVEDPPKVRAARLMFDHLADLALDEPDSLALIARVLAET